MIEQDLEKAALRGEPSYVWRAGQQRRLEMIAEAAGERIKGNILDNGCGIGMYVKHLNIYGGKVLGLEFEFDRAKKAAENSTMIVNASGEALPFPNGYFDLILSHEVIEHVPDDRLAIKEIVGALRAGGRLALFCPNRGYPFETHGIYWRGKYRFGNVPLVNYLPKRLRDRLAPHVRAYSRADVRDLFRNMPVRLVTQRVIFGAYDNIIARWPTPGRLLRLLLQFLERTPLQIFGLSHFVVVEKLD